MQKNYKVDLVSVLNFLRKGRVQLYTPLLKQDAIFIVGPSFKYENNQSAFDLVRDQYFTLWLDSQFNILFTNKDLSEEANNILLKAVEKMFELMAHSQNSTPKFELQLIHTKEKVIEEMLLKAGDMDKKLNELKYAYDKDKALFERKFREYDNKEN